MSILLPASAYSQALSAPNLEIVPRPGSAGVQRNQFRAANLRVDVPLVLINVAVTTPLGQKITGLSKPDFRLFEDGVEQAVTQFSSEDEPISVGLLFDSSGSMLAKLPKARQAAARFFETADPDDEFFLVEFNDRAKLAVPFTNEPGEVEERLRRTRAFGRTALFDAVDLGVREMKKARHRRTAILILSDGGDNRSRHSETEMKHALWESGVQIYALGVLEPSDGRRRSPEEQRGPELLDALAAQSGGGYFPILSLNELPAICARIGLELHSQYVLGYRPRNTERDGKYRRVTVKLAGPDPERPLVVRARAGYYAPLD